MSDPVWLPGPWQILSAEKLDHRVHGAAQGKPRASAVRLRDSTEPDTIHPYRLASNES
jgi:hypothetical protein